MKKMVCEELNHQQRATTHEQTSRKLKHNLRILLSEKLLLLTTRNRLENIVHGVGSMQVVKFSQGAGDPNIKGSACINAVTNVGMCSCTKVS